MLSGTVVDLFIYLLVDSAVGLLTWPALMPHTLPFTALRRYISMDINSLQFHALAASQPVSSGEAGRVAAGPHLPQDALLFNYWACPSSVILARLGPISDGRRAISDVPGDTPGVWCGNSTPTAHRPARTTYFYGVSADASRTTQ